MSLTKKTALVSAMQQPRYPGPGVDWVFLGCDKRADVWALWRELEGQFELRAHWTTPRGRRQSRWIAEATIRRNAYRQNVPQWRRQLWAKWLEIAYDLRREAQL